MRVVVIGFVARSGGALAILQSAINAACEGPSEWEWLFVISDQSISVKSSNVRVARVSKQYGGLLARVRAEFIRVPGILKQFQADVVFSLQNTDHLGRGKAPLAIYMHQSLPFQRERKFSFLVKNERPLAVRQFVLGWIIRRSIHRATVTFVQTRWIRDSLTDLGAGSIVTYVGSPVDISAFTGGQTARPTGFIYPASTAIYKDHHTLHEALRICHSNGTPIGPVRLTIQRAELEQIVGQLTQTERSWYEFLGRVPASRMPELYSRSLLVFPSYIETLGLPLYEAQPYGNPIIASDTKFANEALESYPVAEFFQVGDARNLAHLMAKSWHDIRRRSYTPQFRSIELPTSRHWETVMAGLRDSATGSSGTLYRRGS